jgi:DNA-binding MarR family transcriptional regulator
MEASEVNGRADGAGETPLLRLEDFLPYRLNVLAAAVSEGLARVYSERFGLDIPGWRVLATLGQFSEATATQIGAHSRMHKTKVSRAVAALEARRLISRHANPGDKREAFVALTVEGRRIYAEIVPLALAYQREVLAALPREDVRRLDGLFEALGESARRLSSGGDAPG